MFFFENWLQYKIEICLDRENKDEPNSFILLYFALLNKNKNYYA